MRLARFPSGGILVLDANCLLYHFLKTRPICTYTLYRCEIGDIRAVTSVSIVGEVRHRLMVLEASARFRLPPRKILAYLKRHPEQIRLLRTCIEAVDSLGPLRVEILPLSAEILLASQRLSEDYGLLTTDAILLATLQAHHLTHLASNDTDFLRLRVPGLTVWRP